VPDEAALQCLRTGMVLNERLTLPASVETIAEPGWLWPRDPPVPQYDTALAFGDVYAQAIWECLRPGQPLDVATYRQWSGPSKTNTNGFSTSRGRSVRQRLR
jgi:hypothetical protein